MGAEETVEARKRTRLEVLRDGDEVAMIGGGGGRV